MMNASAGARAMPTKDDPTVSTYSIDFPTPDWQHIKALAALRDQSILEFLADVIERAERSARRGSPIEPRRSPEQLADRGILRERKSREARATTPYILKYPVDGWRHVKSTAALHFPSIRAFIHGAVYAELEEADRSGELRVRMEQ